jgi:hypothetical protein
MMKLVLALGLALLCVSVSADCADAGFTALWTTFQTACKLNVSSTTTEQIWQYETMWLAYEVQSVDYDSSCSNAADAVSACEDDVAASQMNKWIAGNVSAAYTEGTSRNDVSYTYALTSMMQNCWGCDSAANFATAACKLSTCGSYYGNQKCYHTMSYLSYSYTADNTALQSMIDAAYNRSAIDCDEFNTPATDGLYSTSPACTGDGLNASIAWYNAACMTDDHACELVADSEYYSDCYAAFYHLSQGSVGGKLDGCVDSDHIDDTPDMTNSAAARRAYYMYYQCYYEYPANCRDDVVGPQVAAVALATGLDFTNADLYTDIYSDQTNSEYAEYCSLVFSPTSTIGAQLANLYYCEDHSYAYYGQWHDEVYNAGRPVDYESCPQPKYCDAQTVTDLLAVVASYNMSMVCAADGTSTGESGNVPADLSTATASLYTCWYKEDSDDDNTARMNALNTYHTSLNACEDYYQWCDNSEVYERAAAVVAYCPGCTWTDFENAACRSNTSFCATSTANEDCYYAVNSLQSCTYLVGSMADYYTLLTMAAATYDSCTLDNCEWGYAHTGEAFACEECPVNTYSYGGQAMSCEECPEGTTSPAGSESYYDCRSSCTDDEVATNQANIASNCSSANGQINQLALCSAIYPNEFFGAGNNASEMCRMAVGAQVACVQSGSDIPDFEAALAGCAAASECSSDDVDALLETTATCTEKQICNAINGREADDDCQTAVDSLNDCASKNVRNDNGPTSVKLNEWAAAHNSETCPYCGDMSTIFDGALTYCGCAIGQSAADRQECTQTVCDTFYPWPSNSGHNGASWTCKIAGWELQYCDGNSATSAADQQKITDLLAIGSQQNCNFTQDCSTENANALIADVMSQCNCDLSNDMHNLNVLSCFDNLCSDSDCQAAVDALSFCASPQAMDPTTELAQKVGKTVGFAYQTQAHCPLDSSVTCDAESVGKALGAFTGDACGCGSLVGIFALNDTAFDAATDDKNPHNAMVNATMMCAKGVCNPLNGMCDAAIGVLAQCWYPISMMPNYAATLDIAHMVVDQCPAGTVNPYPECDAMHRQMYMQDVMDACACTPSNPRDPKCHENLCSRSSCKSAVAKLYTCLPFANSTEQMMIGAIGNNQAQCQNPKFQPSDCTGAPLQATMDAFLKACPVCNVQDPTFAPGKCTKAICDDTDCQTAYQNVAACYGFTDPADSMMVMAVLPFGEFCDTNTTMECHGRAVQMEIKGLLDTCGCASAADCLKKATDCQFTGDCLATAISLIAKCANDVPSDLATVFNSATDALNACNQPKCDPTTFHTIYPMMPGKVGPECCNGHKGAHGVDGACCMRNSAVTDVQQPDAYVDNDKQPCCFVNVDKTKVGTCSKKDLDTGSSSTVQAGVAAILATLVALLL